MLSGVHAVKHAVRFGVPRVIVAVVTIALTVLASVLTAPRVAVAMFVGVPVMLVVCRWYLRRATPAYQRESAAYATLNGTITESVEGARTVDALRLGPRRFARVNDDLHEAFLAEKATLRLRTVTVPALCVGGGQDSTAGAGGTVILGRTLPNGRAHVFQDAGHGIYRHKPAEFRAMVLDFARAIGLLTEVPA